MQAREKKLSLKYHIGRILSITVLLSGLFFSGCNSHEIQFYDAGTANEKIYAAYLAQDQVCGASHVLVLPVVTEVRRSDVEACVSQILSLDCATWALNDPTPALCLLMQADL